MIYLVILINHSHPKDLHSITALIIRNCKTISVDLGSP